MNVKTSGNGEPALGAAGTQGRAEPVPSLFITYDGLLDPLGSSQILPYILILARRPQPIHILSFEKQERFVEGADSLAKYLQERGISWTPLPFTRRFGKAGKAWDLLKMHAVALGLCREHRFRTVHCRSYQAMQVGCLLRRLFGVAAIFDMRGLWVDERVDGGLWPQDRFLNRVAYRWYKRVESSLLRCATEVVVLTNAVVPELQRIAPGMQAPVTVIPCCADFDHFEPVSDEARRVVRRELGVPPEAFVLSYLGSLGTWYMLEEMLQFLATAVRIRDDVHFMLITRDWGHAQEALLQRLGLGSVRERIHVQPAAREEIPRLIGSSDVMLSFITPAYSKLASSPTKLAEAFALGIPVISNGGVGDVEWITAELDAGALIDLADPDVLETTARNLDRIRAKGGQRLRQKARAYFGLEIAAESYCGVYDRLDRLP